MKWINMGIGVRENEQHEIVKYLLCVGNNDFLIFCRGKTI